MKKILYLIGSISVAIILTFPINTVTDIQGYELIENTEQTTNDFDLSSNQTKSEEPTEIKTEKATENKMESEIISESEEESENETEEIKENTTQTPESSNEDLIDTDNKIDSWIEQESTEQLEGSEQTEPSESQNTKPNTTEGIVKESSESTECVTEFETVAQTQTEQHTEFQTEKQTEESTITPSIGEIITEKETKKETEETHTSAEYINLANYAQNNFYNSLNDNEIKIVKAILTGAENARYGNESEIKIMINGLTPDWDIHLINTNISVYLQRFTYSPRIHSMLYESDNQIQVRIDMNLYRERIAKREYIEKEAEIALSTFTEGDELHKLRQISDWISGRFKYQSMQLDVYPALTTGYGNCNAYGLLFKLMAERIGIPCDICIGNSDIGKHLWNRVTLSDGRVFFYDISYYHNSGNNANWIESTTSPWPKYVLNNYY